MTCNEPKSFKVETNQHQLVLEDGSQFYWSENQIHEHVTKTLLRSYQYSSLTTILLQERLDFTNQYFTL